MEGHRKRIEKIADNLRIYTPCIAEGSYGKVFKGVLKMDDGKKVNVAVKMTKHHIINNDEKQNFEKELRILEQMEHPNIVKYYSSGIYKNNSYIVIEWCEYGALENFIKKGKKNLSEDEARIIFKSFMEGLNYLHKKGISHRDIKPLNLLIDHNKQLKIADFGTAGFKDKNQLNMTHGLGTPYYTPYEMVYLKKKAGYDGKKSDIWSSGLTLYKMIKGEEFWNEATSQIDIYNGLKSFNGIKSSKLEGFSPELKDLLQRMLKRDFKQRISVEEILASKWMKKSSNLHVTAQKLVSSMIELAFSDTDKVIEYINIQFREQLTLKVHEFFKKLREMEYNLKDLKREDTNLSLSLYFSCLLKIVYLLDKVLLRTSISQGGQNDNLKISDIIDKKVFNEINRFLVSKIKELRELEPAIKDITHANLNINNPNDFLIQKIIAYTVEQINDEFLNDFRKMEAGSIYILISIAFKLLLQDLEKVDALVKIDYNKLEEMGINIDQHQIEEMQKKGTFFRERNLAIKINDELILRFEAKPIRQMINFDRGREEYHKLLVKKLSPLARAMRDRCEVLEGFNKKDILNKNLKEALNNNN